MGSGKTSVLGEASDLLAGRHIVHAAIDLDALGLAHIESGETRTMMYRNLQCVCENYAALGVTRLLVARAIEDRAELEFCRSVVSATNTVVCRLTASIEIMEQRVRMRESGMRQQDYLARVGELNAILDRVRLEDFTVNSANRSVTEIAQEMLIKAGWICE
jgi:adenylylsulfate kinase